jgi:hypothetical protein
MCLSIGTLLINHVTSVIDTSLVLCLAAQQPAVQPPSRLCKIRFIILIPLSKHIPTKTPSRRLGLLQPLVGRLVFYFKLISTFRAISFISSFAIFAFNFKSLISTFSNFILSPVFFIAFLINSIGILAQNLQ